VSFLEFFKQKEGSDLLVILVIAVIIFGPPAHTRHRAAIGSRLPQAKKDKLHLTYLVKPIVSLGAVSLGKDILLRTEIDQKRKS